MGQPRKVTVAVSGGIAAYRAVDLVRALQTAGFDPHVAMTPAAERFVTPLTFAAISGHRVLTTLWTGPEVPAEGSSIEHIAEAQSTKALIVAPATADIVAKFAHGLADDIVTTLYLATPAPVILAPAMNSVMWNHPAVQANIAMLRARGHHIIAPANGHLACGMTGDGRLAPIPEIVTVVEQVLQPPQTLAGETVLITAGGTREPLDPVRFLGNRSSGRMGYALAEAALARGAQVILIAANVVLPSPAGAQVIPVSTSTEMHATVLAQLARATLVLMAAAVADFRPSQAATSKLTRDHALTLTLEPTQDIVADAARRRQPGTILVAFAAETPGPGEDAIPRARAKLARKGVDAIVLNDVSLPNQGFDSDQNSGVFLTPSAQRTLPLTSKRQMAGSILDEVVGLRRLSPLLPPA